MQNSALTLTKQEAHVLQRSPEEQLFYLFLNSYK